VAGALEGLRGQAQVRERFDVATVGNYTKDTIVTSAGTRHVDGGGFNYAAFAAAALGLKVAAITRLSAEDTHVVDALRDAGIEVFAETTPSSTLMRLEYPTANVDERILTAAATAGSFTTDQVRGVEARAFVISPSIRGEVPTEVIQELREKSGATISADAQGFIRVRDADGSLHHREWPEREEVLALIDILKADAVEAESLTGETDLRRAARGLARLGPREVVLTHRNGLLVLARGRFHAAEFHSKTLVGRSGRGDTCVGSYVAARLSAPPAEATWWAAATTSLKLEAEGPIRRSREEIEAFMKRKYARV
jgi:sugar/nucleoside kinase (ribokinase family)